MQLYVYQTNMYVGKMSEASSGSTFKEDIFHNFTTHPYSSAKHPERN
jgi:hypothetical protein